MANYIDSLLATVRWSWIVHLRSIYRSIAFPDLTVHQTFLLARVKSYWPQTEYKEVGSEAEFLDVIQTKDLLVFLLAIYSHLYSFAFRFIFLQTHATSYSF